MHITSLRSRGNFFTATGTDENGQQLSVSYTAEQAIETGKQIDTLHPVRIAEYLLQKSKPNTSGTIESP